MSSESTAPMEPEYGGQCAFAVGLGKADDPEAGTHRLEQDGRLFYFKNAVAKFLFTALRRTDKADAKWAARST